MGGLAHADELRRLRDSGVQLTQEAKEKLAAADAMHEPEITPEQIDSAEKLAEQALIDYDEKLTEVLAAIEALDMQGLRALHETARRTAQTARRIGGSAMQPARPPWLRINGKDA